MGAAGCGQRRRELGSRGGDLQYAFVRSRRPALPRDVDGAVAALFKLQRDLNRRAALTLHAKHVGQET